MTRRTTIERFFEILPGLLMWSTFILPFALAFVAPKTVSIVVMIYAVYWFFRTMNMSYHLVQGYKGYRAAEKVNWHAELKAGHPKSWDRTMHLLFIPLYKEEFPIIEATFDALLQSTYPTARMIPILCIEERAGADAQKVARAVKKKYAKHFPHFFMATHPSDTPGEVKGKGPNITYAAHQIVPKILKLGYKKQNLLVTTLDTDNRVDPKYFSCVTKAFLETDEPKYYSYQPLPLYFNNIWDVPFFIRMIALGSSFWVMVEATRPERLRNFSAHSQSLEGLLVSDYWSVKTVVEDGHQYWRSYYALKGKHYVVPIFIPIYQDAVLADSFWETIRQQYLQKRRWAWGVSDIAFVVKHNLEDKGVPFWDKWKQFTRLFEGHYSWATTSLVLAFAGWPPLLINQAYQNTVFAYNFSTFHGRILLVAGIGMIIALVVSTLILPPPPKHYKNHKWLIVRDWILTPIFIPVTNIFLGALPAIDSQTRLMFGKYMEVFHFTLKKVLPPSKSK